MGSVIDYIECPRCGNESYNDYYYKTGEEYTNCNNCGYHRSAELKRDNDGKFITKDGTLNYEFDNLIMEYNESSNPYGAYRYKHRDAVGTNCGTLETESDCDNFKSDMELNKPLIAYASISRYLDGQIIETILIDNLKENED